MEQMRSGAAEPGDREHTLRVVLPVAPGASIYDWMTSITDANAYHSASVILGLCRTRLGLTGRVDYFSQAPTYAQFEQLEMLTGTTAETLFQATPHRFAPVLMPRARQVQRISFPGGRDYPLLAKSVAARQILPTANAQYCPVCLDESLHHRLIWMPRAVSLCVAHKVLLVDRCAGCQSRLTVAALVRGACAACGHSLRYTPPRMIDGDRLGLQVQHILQSWLLNDGSVSPADTLHLPEQPPDVLYRLIDGLRACLADRPADFIRNPLLGY